METHFTLGKWMVRKTVDNSGDYPFPTYDIMAIRDWGPENVGCAYEKPYNALIMAASPDMLKALLEIKKAFNGGIFDKDKMQDELLDKYINPAIAKATGQPQ